MPISRASIHTLSSHNSESMCWQAWQAYLCRAHMHVCNNCLRLEHAAPATYTGTHKTESCCDAVSFSSSSTSASSLCLVQVHQ